MQTRSRSDSSQATETKVLFIGGDSASSAALTALRSAGYQVTLHLPRLQSWPTLSQLQGGHYQIVLVDHQVSGRSGSYLLPNLRELVDAPIVVLGVDDEDSTVQSLMQGADACLPSAASPEAIKAYLGTLLRRQRVVDKVS